MANTPSPVVHPESAADPIFPTPSPAVNSNGAGRAGGGRSDDIKSSNVSCSPEVIATSPPMIAVQPPIRATTLEQDILLENSDTESTTSSMLGGLGRRGDANNAGGGDGGRRASRRGIKIINKMILLVLVVE